MPCNINHARIISEARLADLSNHQMHNNGRHKCCQCAYNSGYDQGARLSTAPTLNIDDLGTSQAAADGRHKSVHQAFALGYSDGIEEFINSHR